MPGGFESGAVFVDSLRVTSIPEITGIHLKPCENVAEMLQGKKDLR